MLLHPLHPSLHLLDDHLPGVGFQFELMLERGLRGLHEGEVSPQLVEQRLHALQVKSELLDFLRSILLPAVIVRRPTSLVSLPGQLRAVDRSQG